jgi:hypothetical protein
LGIRIFGEYRLQNKEEGRMLITQAQGANTYRDFGDSGTTATATTCIIEAKERGGRGAKWKRAQYLSCPESVADSNQIRVLLTRLTKRSRVNFHNTPSKFVALAGYPHSVMFSACQRKRWWAMICGIKFTIPGGASELASA